MANAKRTCNKKMLQVQIAPGLPLENKFSEGNP